MDTIETKVAGGVIRGILMFVLGNWALKNGISPNSISEVASGLGALAVLGWSIWAHRTQHVQAVNTVAKAVEAVPAQASIGQKEAIVSAVKAGKF